MNETAAYAYIISSIFGFILFYIIRFKDYKVGNKPNILGWIAIFCTIFMIISSFFGFRERNRKSQLNNEQTQTVPATFTKQIYETILITVTTKADIIKLLGTPIDTKIVNDVDTWLYMQKSREANTSLFKISLTLKFKSNNTVFSKAYAEHYGNENISKEKLLRQIRVNVSTQNDVKNILGIPTRVGNINGKIHWRYDHTKKIYCPRSQGQWTKTKIINFDSDRIVVAVNEGGSGGGGVIPSEFDDYYTP